MLGQFAVLTLNHKYYTMSRVERACFSDVRSALNDLVHIDGVIGLVILQTCNRVELYVHYTEPDSIRKIIDRWEIIVNDKNLSSDVIVLNDADAVNHLFRVVSGLESIAIGENEILHQVRDAYKLANESKALSRFLRSLFEEALKVGKDVRSKTLLGRVKISLADVAVDIAEKISVSFNDKTIIVIGAGETGTLVVKSLNQKSSRKFTILVANRTYEKAIELANSVNGIALHLSDLDRYLNVADIVFVTTSAPHFILTKERIRECMKMRKTPLLIIDLSIPRNVDPEIKNIPNVQVITIDDLKSHAININAWRNDIEKVESMIKDAVNKFVHKWENNFVEEFLADLYKYAESIRKEEVDEALRMLGSIGSDERVKTILENMSKMIVKRLLYSQTEFLRKSYVLTPNKE